MRPGQRILKWCCVYSAHKVLKKIGSCSPGPPAIEASTAFPVHQIWRVFVHGEYRTDIVIPYFGVRNQHDF
ncbi:unnamed protein product [Bursaphelenchus xylophilus]|uniref:(pine wood nematode) hypothetical protein n=1 Tax=Bursaphelenchus xylophilus TaxID=6326 RepID=A0A7I8X0Q7_BURXY|nr:unnamed protein product [Bursaphelenchus xylophilus]CAG9130115.1 unnamed protein product [Bursaphelenchus xylophilus]